MSPDWNIILPSGMSAVPALTPSKVGANATHPEGMLSVKVIGISEFNISAHPLLFKIIFETNSVSFATNVGVSLITSNIGVLLLSSIG